MFEKRDFRTFPGVSRDELWSRSWDWWSRQGFHLSKTGPYRFHGSSFYSRIGLRRELELAIDGIPGGSSADLRFNAQITDEGLVAGAVTTVVFFPVAVLGGALSYTEYETDAQNLIAAFWQYLSSPTDRAAGPTLSSVSMAPPPCQGCGAALLPDWKVCPYCGRRREGVG